MKKARIIVPAAVALFAFAAFVWPTLYWYPSGRNVVRVNRITGTAYQLTSFGWQEMRAMTDEEVGITPQ